VSTKAQATSRLTFIDLLRGVGVLLMVQLHTSHGWLHPDARTGFAWFACQFLGGLAAPIFLTLAGVSAGLRWGADAARERAPRYGDDLRRALQLIVLGYLLRLQMWFIDAGGYSHGAAWLAQLLLLTAYALALFTLGRRSWLPLRTASALLLALGLFALGLVQVAQRAPERLVGLLRVDVLQCIGGSLVLVIAAAAAFRDRFARASGYLLLAVAAAALTVWTRSWVPGPLPPPIAAYLGQWVPANGRSVVGLFPLFPWVAYALAGAAIGLTWARAPEDQRERLVLRWSLFALVAALATTESAPHVYETFRAQPWLVQPVRVANRLAWVLAWAGPCVLLARHAGELSTPIVTLGRASLLVYWVHLQFAFGAASSRISKSLTMPAWACGTLLLLAAMWLLAWVRQEYPRLRWYVTERRALNRPARR
jgi:uncharacterized membrane protein